MPEPGLPDPITGEEAIVQGYLAPLAAGAPGALGLRDDCALITPPPGTDLVVTVDAVAAGTHFFADDRPADIGWKALAVNVSDLAGKGATPLAYVLSLALPAAPTPAFLSGLVDGLREAQSAFGITLVGGDTDRRPDAPLTLTITAFGTVPGGRMVRRTTARPGDVLFASGTLGDSALGLGLRRGDPQTSAWPLDAAERAALVARYLRPPARTALGPALLAHARAAMDLSDGLLKDLGRMLDASGVGADHDRDRLPLSPAAAKVVAHDARLWSAPLGGGDDYEVLAAVPPEAADAFARAAAAAGVAVTAIGACRTELGLTLRDREGREIEPPRAGYDHF